MDELKCPKCERKFQKKVHLGRHLQASHGSKEQRKKELVRSKNRITGLRFLENKAPSEVLDTMSDALAALRVLFDEQATELKTLRKDVEGYAKTMKHIEAFNESLKKQKRLGDLT